MNKKQDNNTKPPSVDIRRLVVIIKVIYIGYPLAPRTGKWDVLAKETIKLESSYIGLKQNIIY